MRGPGRRLRRAKTAYQTAERKNDHGQTATAAGQTRRSGGHPTLRAQGAPAERLVLRRHAVVGTTLQIVGELLCEPPTCAPGRRCSTSPPATAMSPAAARRWCEVVVTDYVKPARTRRERADAERFRLRSRRRMPRHCPSGASFDVWLQLRRHASTPLLNSCACARPAASWCASIGRTFQNLGRCCRPPGPRVRPVGRRARLSAVVRGGGCFD